MTKKFGWTKSVLIHQIENQSYEKTLLGQTNFDKALTPKLKPLDLRSLLTAEALAQVVGAGGRLTVEMIVIPLFF
jgi:hypothetical protein